MPRAKPGTQRGPRVPLYDPADRYPVDYHAGQSTANRLIDQSPRLWWVLSALRLSEHQLATWVPARSGRSALTEQQYARSRGFLDTLTEYLTQIGT